MKVNIKRANENAIIPKYETAGSAGMDLASCEDITILPGQVIAVNTGLKMEIPIGYELQVRSRSGLALKKNIFILNAPGTVDSDFRGEIKAIICNASNQNFAIRIGDRIAQGVVTNYEKVEFNEIEELSSTERGEGGFGSTGVSIETINV